MQWICFSWASDVCGRSCCSLAFGQTETGPAWRGSVPPDAARRFKYYWDLEGDSVAVERVSECFLQWICTRETHSLQAVQCGRGMLFSFKIYCQGHKATQQITNFCLIDSDSPESYQRSLPYFLDPGIKRDAHDDGVWSVHDISRLKIGLNPLIVSFCLNRFTNGFTKTFIRKKASLDTLAISRTGFRYDHCKCKC